MLRSSALPVVISLMLGAVPFTAPLVHASEQQPLIDVLKSDAPAAEKAMACRELKRVGGVEAVSSLAELLTDKSISHEARNALESMPYAEAGAALREAVGKTSGLIRAGIIDSLGERRDLEATAIIAASLNDKEIKVVASAALALAKIGTVDAARLLSESYEKTPEKHHAVIGDGLVRCADELLRADETSDAAAIYRKLAESGQPRTVREAALRGVVQSAGERTATVVREYLASDDPTARAAGAFALRELPATGLKAVAAKMDGLPAESRRALLMAGRIRRERSLAASASEAARGEDESLALVGIAAVGCLAGSSGVDVLVPLTAAEGARADAAWRSLEALRGAGVDAKLVAAMHAEEDAGRRARLIKLLLARRVYQAVPALLAESRSEQGEVRSAALEAVQRLASPESVPAIVSLMLTTPKGADRDELEKAVMLAVAQIAEVDTRTEAVLRGVDLKSDAQRVAFLPVLGRIGGPKALEVVQSALKSHNPEVYEAGVRAISNWPDASVADQLLELARGAREKSHRIWALRALIRVISLPGDKPDAERLAALKQAMSMATRDEERLLIVERAAAVRTIDTLRFVAPHLDQPATAQQACRTVVELAHHEGLRKPNQKQFDPVLKKVIAISKDLGLVDRAKRYLGQK